MNGAVDFTHAYASDRDVFDAAVAALLDRARRAPLPRTALTTG